MAFVLGVLVGGHPSATGLDRLPGALRDRLLEAPAPDALGAQILAILRDHYYRPVNADALRSASVQGMVAALHDPYTAYLDPADLAAMRLDQSGEYGGVGMEVRPRGRAIVIQGVVAGAPAARAGIRPGMYLRSVDGVRVGAATIGQSVARVRGPVGTTVRLVVAPTAHGPARTYALVRAAIERAVVLGRMAPGAPRVADVRLEQFTRGSAAALKARITALLGAGARSVVLDLRGDPGGLVDEAVGVASIFLPKGAPIVTTQGEHESRSTLRARGGAIPASVPLVVLVDETSASSSEIVAGALRDDGRATLVGEHTFGKALVQATVPLRNGGALKLTTASYLTPHGISIAGHGLEPRVRVRDNPHTAVDEALERAVAVARAALRP